MLLKKFFKFVLPSIVSMWIFALYTMVDGMFVSWGVGESALASVNLSMPYVIMIFTIGLLMATGTSTLISVSLGKKEEEQASRLFTMNLAVLTVLSLAVTAVSLIFLEPIALFLGASPDNITYVKEYVGTISVFAVFFILSYNMEALVKTDGTPMVSAIGVTACGLTNVILDYVFVMKFHWGVFGAAFATGLAQVASTVIFFIYFAKFRKILRFRKFKLDFRVYKRIIPLGMANGFTELSGGLVVFMFNQVILAVIGEAGIVSYTVISYINTLVLNTMSGIAQGVQPIISYHYGASERSSCRKLLKYAMLMTISVSAVYVLMLEFCPSLFVGIFLPKEEAELFSYTGKALQLYSLSFLFLGFNVVSAGYFTAVEKPVFSFLISAGRGLAFLAGALGILVAALGEIGIWLSPLVSETVCAVMTAVFFAAVLRKKRSGEADK